jgi:DNA-binding transcriptional regulator YiaG
MPTPSESPKPSKRRATLRGPATVGRPRDDSPSGSEVRSVRDRLGLTQELFARLAGFPMRAVADWESGRTLAATKARRLLEIDRLQQALARVMVPSAIGPWLQSPNEAFSGLTPIEAIERGEVDRIWRMIYELESGIPT